MYAVSEPVLGPTNQIITTITGPSATPASDRIGTCVHEDRSHIETLTFDLADTGTAASPCNHGHRNNTATSASGNAGAGMAVTSSDSSLVLGYDTVFFLW